MTTVLGRILDKHETEILSEWLRLQHASLTRRRDLISDGQLRANSQDFLAALSASLSKDDGTDISNSAWAGVRELIADMSRQRVSQGLTPSETAMFVFSLKRPLLSFLRTEAGSDAATLAEETWRATVLLDALGLYSTEVYQKTREEVIVRQQQELMELSTPVVQLWTGILALPLIGTLDSARTQVVMQNLLEAIVNKEADLAIIDITGVPTVDTLVAQHLLKTVAAARLMGADCIICGIRPQIAQTIIHLGVDLSDVITKASLSDAFQLALRKKKLSIVKNG